MDQDAACVNPGDKLPTKGNLFAFSHSAARIFTFPSLNFSKTLVSGRKYNFTIRGTKQQFTFWWQQLDQSAWFWMQWIWSVFTLRSWCQIVWMSVPVPLLLHRYFLCGKSSLNYYFCIRNWSDWTEQGWARTTLSSGVDNLKTGKEGKKIWGWESEKSEKIITKMCN